ncbi:hypothetical protein ABB37_04055 [Leptomonas pyrrhocoris]|uniref:Uncharacterized protein n=1 Tax=Leptomonas pyrrhocoris TaxID=157538 RepID=A0A0M9G3S3_LEPPY|nr:hypothetical protein ABB37_04055 [Leptomonas pyrrhocoris]KPA81775.1 hypothetical protein ABB37_04055 [Leptomonas pyrrhocoris]|eukprot:XP_015660214.1 hypothetical protein ABB37_04055 [Leptomonas pyrrhocoris]
MNGTKQRPLRDATAAHSRPHHRHAPFSVGEGHHVSGAGSADRQAPSSAPRRPSLSTSGDHTFSSSIAISSDTADVSPELSARAFNSPPDTSGSTAVATAASKGRQSPYWWGASTSLLSDSSAATVTATAAAPLAAPGGPSDSSCVVSQGLRCSIDFSHEIEWRAEAELQQLWVTLWCATHSEAALAAALDGPRAPWNPYRPLRGGQGVREEVLNSEVAEFREMVTVDSLYLQGTAIQPGTHLVHSAPSATTSPHRPPKKTKDGHAALQQREQSEEEVFTEDNSSATLHLPPMQPLASSAGAEVEVDAHYTEAWWAAHRADGEAALFCYLWEAVVVPFYTAPSAVVFPLPFASLDLATTAADATLTLACADVKEEKDASGVVTAFWPTKEDKRNWVVESGRRSVSPTCVRTPLSVGDGESDRGVSSLARTQRSGGGLPFYLTEDVNVVSDDSLEVEVLEDDKTNENDGLKTEETPHSAKLTRQQHMAPSTRIRPERRNSRRHDRPSTAGIQATALSPSEATLLGMPIPVSVSGAALAAKQRARSARTDEGASIPTSSSLVQPNAAGRGWRSSKMPTLRTTFAESLAELTMDAPLPKPASVTRQRPPTAQPVVSKSRRVASPSASAQARAAHSVHSHASNKDDRATGSRTTTTAATTTFAAGVKTPTAASAAVPRTGTSSPGRRNAGGGNALQSQRPPRQLPSGGNEAINHALQLLELRDRPTSRSPLAQCRPFPSASAAPLDAHRKGRSRTSPQLDDVQEVSGVKESPPRSHLSLVTAAPQQKRRLRHVHDHTSSTNSASCPPTVQGEEVKKAPTMLGLGGSEKLVYKERLAPLREPTASSDTLRKRSPALLEMQRGAAAAGRTPSPGSQRRKKGGAPRSSSENKRNVQHRPTTAQR